MGSTSCREFQNSYLAENILTLLEKDDMYGLQLQEKIHEITDGKYWVNIATIYNTLKKLESDGFVESWQDEQNYPERGGRPRKYYTITYKGRRDIEYLRETRKKFVDWQPAI